MVKKAAKANDAKPKKHKLQWKKGHSCASNPVTNKFRQAAKERLFTVNVGPSSLTVDAIARHEAQHVDEDEKCDTLPQFDALSIGATTAGKTNCTWASQWTDCSNITFGRVMQRFAGSNLAQHKEVMAVLAAVTEEIKSRGGKESNTEYFAALMTVLDSELDMQSYIAVAYLISVVIKKVPTSALRSRFPDISRSLMNRLAWCSVADKADGGSPILRSLILCMSYLLSSLDRSAWTNEYTLHVFRSLLPFVASPKAKVRKAAHHAMGVVLRGSAFMKADGTLSLTHPGAAEVSKYCREEIDKCGSSGDMTAVLHVLELLKSVMSEFPKSSLKSSCEMILGLLELRNVLVSGVAMKTLHSMFSTKPKATSLPAELNAQIIQALYEHKPNETDIQPMEAWLAVMEQAHCNLARLSDSDCFQHLPRLFSTCMKCIHSGKLSVAKMAAEVMMTLLKQCVAPSIDLATKLVHDTPAGASSPIHKMFRSIEAGLGYQFVAVWDLVLMVIAQFFEVLGKSCHSIMTKCLLALADLRDYHGFEHKDLLDKTFGMAVRTMGPQIVLTAVPLHTSASSGDVDLARSWLLPVFRDHVQQTELAFFAQYFLPLASQLKTKCDSFEQAGRKVELKTYSAMTTQIWSMLPGFCTRPTDLTTSFKLVAQTLGECLASRPDIRMEVLGALRKVLQHCEHNSEEQAAVSKYAKNFLPRLFNLIAPAAADKKDATRLAAIETLKCFLKVSDQQLIHQFAEKCVELVSDASTVDTRKPLLMDLLITFVPYLDLEHHKQLFELVKTMLEDDDINKALQKKCYRILEEMCAASSTTSNCKQFLTSIQKKFINLLLATVTSANPSSSAPRLRCIMYFLRQLEKPAENLLKTIVPEALVCTKAAGERARSAAYGLLVEVAHTFVRWHPELSRQDAIHQYIVLVMAGFAGDPQMISCTVLALTKLVHDFKGHVDDSLLEVLVDSACLLLTSKPREVVQSAIGFIKTLILGFEAKIGQFLTKIVSSLVTMKEDCHHHFRFKTKEIFALLVRKFGYKIILDMLPESHHKLLNNMRKTEERKERQKKETTVSADGEDNWPRKRKRETVDEMLHSSDSELDDTDDGPTSKKKSKRAAKTDPRGSAWLKEDEDIVDFLDPSAAKKVVATRPESSDAANKPKQVKHDFKVSADGRLIITDDSMQQDANNKKSSPQDDEDIDELMDAVEGIKPPAAQASKSKYKAGGKGIHRDTKAIDVGQQYRAKKAGGDIKKAGKPDPYAYLPLQHQFLNKRKKAKSAGQFAHLVKGARKGAVKGQKLSLKKKKKSKTSHK